MTVEIKNILKKVKDAKCNNPTTASLWLIAVLTDGLDESIVPIDDVDVQKLSRADVISRDKYNIVINLDFIDENVSITDEQISEYREIWKGLFTGSMGSAESIRSKLERWLKHNPDYTFEDVCKAAHYWIENKSREVSHPAIIGRADYFIYKKEGKDEMSRLSSIIDDAINDSSPTDWSTTVL